MNPTVSIIVPIYNVELYLQKCIDSVLAQTFSDFELILVDDGSPDKCGKICDEYAELDNRIKVIHKNNGGVSSARNAGIELAKGIYIAFVDGDDYIDKQMIEILYNQAVLHSSDIVVCEFMKVNQKGVPINSGRSSSIDSNIKHFTNIQVLNQMFISGDSHFTNGAGNNVMWVIVTTRLFKKHLFDNLKFTEGMICEDEMISHEVIFRSEKTTYIPRSLYYYVQRQNSTINSPFSLKRFDKVYALKERADFFRRMNLHELHHKAVKCYVDAFFWNYFKAKTELTNIHKDLKKLKRTLDKSFISLIKNPILGWKQKVFLCLFIINPYILDIFIRYNIKSGNP